MELILDNPISRRIVVIYVMKSLSPFEFYGRSMGTEITAWSRFPSVGKAIVRQILASEEISKSKGTLRVTVNPSRKVNCQSRVIWDRKVIALFARLIGSTRIGWSALRLDIKVCKSKHRRCVGWKNIVCVSWNSIKNCRPKRWSLEENEIRHWVK